MVKPFLVTGVDFAGPFRVKESIRRNAPVTIAYLSLFLCLSTEALFLELVPALTTQVFIDTLKIFIARRGTPSLIVSDWGTDFIDTANYPREVDKRISCESTPSDPITFGALCGSCTPFQSTLVLC